MNIETRREKLDDPTWLTHMYLDAHHGIGKIGALCGATDAQVRRALARAGIPERTGGRRNRYPQLSEPEFMVQKLTIEGLTLRGVARIVGCSEQTVRAATLQPETAAQLSQSGWSKEHNSAAARRRGTRRDGEPMPTRDEILTAVRTVAERTGRGALLREVLSTLTGCEPNTVRRHLNHLARSGMLEVRPRRGESAGRPPHEYHPVTR